MNNKEILIVSNYFPPEKGAASNRIFSLANGLSINGYKVTVVCPLPNYPQGKIHKHYKGKFYKRNIESFGSVHRLWVWPTISGNKFVRLLSMLSFSFSLKLFLIFKKTPKKVIIQYSPVLIGFIAVLWSKFLQKKVILNISDLWPLAGLEMGVLKKGFYYSVLAKMERFCYKNSHLILGQSQEILDHVTKGGVSVPLFLYRNIPDFKPPAIPTISKKKNIKIVYAGLLGVAQGLFSICSKINFPKHIQLHIYGNGPESEKINNTHFKNVFYHGEFNREDLIAILPDYQISIIPLIKRIYGSVPSKIFEHSRVGLPLLYYAGGEGENIVKKYNLGWTVPVNNINQLQLFINQLTIDKLNEYRKEDVQNSAVDSFKFEKQFQDLLQEF